MSSINTNAGAMTALQTLKATNKAMDVTQNRIATGFRVSEASHNAAYWSLATTMRSDNNAMSTVQDALGLGAAQVDVAYTAMDVVKDTLDTIKSKLVAASQPGVDQEKIQAEISQLQKDLQTYADSATFSGGNWLSVDSKDTQQVVASFTRSAEGSVSLQTIDVDLANIALFVNGEDTTETGLLQGTVTYSDAPEGANAVPGVAALTPATATGAGGAGGVATVSLTGITWEDGDTFSFDVTIDSGSAVTVTGTYDGSNWTFEDEPTGVTAAISGGNLTLTATTDALADGDAMTVGEFGSTREPAAVDPEDGEEEAGDTVTSFNISEMSKEHIGDLISHVDGVLAQVTSAASELGAIKSRIDSQSSFVGKIMDAVNRGIGQLVDADMTEESSRLQALQVQQQLGIQSLSMANSNSQVILSLFR